MQVEMAPVPGTSENSDDFSILSLLVYTSIIPGFRMLQGSQAWTHSLVCSTILLLVSRIDSTFAMTALPLVSCHPHFLKFYFILIGG